MAQVPACSSTDKFGRARLVTTLSKASLNKYEFFKEMTRDKLRHRDWDTVDMEKITDSYRRNYTSPYGISPIPRADPYSAKNRFRPTPSPTIQSQYQPMPIQTRRLVSFRGQQKLPEIRISPASESLGRAAIVDEESVQYPLRPASRQVPSSIPSRLLTVTAPIPSGSFKKVIHTTHSLIENMEKKCPDSCSEPSRPPPPLPPPSRRADRLMLQPPYVDIPPPRRPYSPPASTGIRGNINMLTAISPDRSDNIGPRAIKERPSKTIKRTTVSNTKDKKIVTEEVSEIFDRSLNKQSKRSSLCQPCPSKSPMKRSREPSTYVALPLNKQRSSSCVSSTSTPYQRKTLERDDLAAFRTPYEASCQPGTGEADDLFGASALAEFKKKPSKVMHKKTIADKGSTRVVSQEMKEIFKTDRSCTAVEDPNSAGTNKGAVMKIIKLFLEIMSQLLKINSVKAY